MLSVAVNRVVTVCICPNRLFHHGWRNGNLLPRSKAFPEQSARKQPPLKVSASSHSQSHYHSTSFPSFAHQNRDKTKDCLATERKVDRNKENCAELSGFFLSLSSHRRNRAVHHMFVTSNHIDWESDSDSIFKRPLQPWQWLTKETVFMT